jgi:DNA-binding MarR family transcriptional regulator
VAAPLTDTPATDRPVTEGDVDRLADGVRTTVTRLSRELRQQAATSMTATQLSVLGSIHRAGSISLGELAGRERLSAPMISKVVASLEDQDLIERSTDEHDRRVCLVRVSRAGRRWIDRELARSNARIADRLQALTARERAAVAAALPLLDRLAGDDG